MIESSVFHKEIEHSVFNQYNEKKMITYGKDWYEVLHDIESISIIIISKLSMPNDLNIQYINTNEDKALILSSCEWEVDLLIELTGLISNKKSINSNIYMETVLDQDSAIANSMINLERAIKEEMKLIPSHYFNSETYADKSYKDAFLALLNANKISHVDGLLNKKGFNPIFNDCIVKCVREA